MYSNGKKKPHDQAYKGADKYPDTPMYFAVMLFFIILLHLNMALSQKLQMFSLFSLFIFSLQPALFA